VSDAIAAWVEQGYAYGPVDEEDLPPDAKVNGILTRYTAVFRGGHTSIRRGRIGNVLKHTEQFS
jgi:hypothetical protein